MQETRGLRVARLLACVFRVEQRGELYVHEHRPEGESRANLHVGGRAEKASLTDREREICAIIGPALAERGLVFVGIDVIGDYLTEINVTSPTGLQEINRFDGVALERDIWDAIERRFHASRGQA